jgi:hypothetical protein
MNNAHPNWLPTEAQMQAAIARQRAYNARQSARLEGPESVYVGPGWVRPQPKAKPAPWWRRLLDRLR